MKNFPDIPKDLGKLLQVSARDPFLVTNSDSVYVVRKGSLDIFYLTLENSEPSGARHHVCRLGISEVAIGIPGVHSDSTIGLLAVPNVDTELLELSRKDFVALAMKNESEGYSDLIDNWVSKLSTGVFNPSTPPVTSLEMKAGSDMSLPSSTPAVSQSGVVWIKPNDNEIQVLNDDALKVQPGELFPVASNMWIESSADTKIILASTFEILSQQHFENSSGKFYNLLFSFLNLTIQKNFDQERERLRLEENFEQKRFLNSFKQLASILQPGISKLDFRDVSTNELFSACRIVGDYLGIEMKLDASQHEGLTVKDPVNKIATASKVRVRKVQLESDWWEKDTGALLAFNSDGSPVAIIPIGKEKYKLVDPSDLSEKILTRSAALDLKPDAYTFYKPLPYEPVNFYELLKFGLRESKIDLRTILLVGLAGGLLGLLVPYFTGLIFQDIIPSSDKIQLNQLIYILIASAFAGALFQVTRSIATLRIEGKMNSSVQAAIWDRLLKLPVPFFRNFTTGNLSTRALGIDQMLQIVTGIALTTILTSIFSFLNFFMLYYYDPSLAIWATVFIVIVFVVIVFFEYSNLKYLRNSQILTQKISGLSYQLITGMSKIRVSGAERNAYSEWSKVFAEERENEFKSGLIENRLSVFFSVIPVVALIVIFFNIAFVKPGGTMDTGTFIGFNAAFTIFLAAVISLGQSISSLMQAVPIYENLRPIIDTLPEVEETKPEANQFSGNVEVNNVVFRYSPEGAEVLKGFSLTAKAGEFVAIVGPSGAGKSTLFRILLGFDKPESGAVFYDGVDLNTLDLQSVRKQFGVVLQNGKLIPGPILSNIIGSSNLTIDDAWEAAEMAGIADDIKEMPMGMFTIIDDDADTISGGQKQRIMIARAIVHKPKIVLFDEATSALDNISQDIVTESIEKLNATRLVIAHRLSTVIKADKLYVINEGQIAEEGTYDGLMKQQGIFYDLAKRQLI